MSRRKRGAWLFLAALLLLLGAVLRFRSGTGELAAGSTQPPAGGQEPSPSAPAATPTPSEPAEIEPAVTEPAETEPPEVEPPETTSEPADQTEPEEASIAADAPVYRPIRYDERSYQLVTDMVYAFKNQVPNRERVIAADVEALKEHDLPLGEAWGGIMEYWDYADNRMEINDESLPEDLPRDDSLCIVVLGYQLKQDGSMAQEMLGRCELALRAAQQYPNAYLLLTGGGTALMNREVTEAGVMAAWFREQGIAEERLILEDQSATTDQNARFSLAILTEQYPQIHSLVIVSSDYHLPLGCLLFTEAALLYGCEHGQTPYAVLSNLGLRGYGLNEYTNPVEQGLYVWALANPQQ